MIGMSNISKSSEANIPKGLKRIVKIMNVPDEGVYHKHVMYIQRYINVMNVPDEGVCHKHVMYTNRDINVMNVPDEGVYHKHVMYTSSGTFITLIYLLVYMTCL
jgi:hypothetical protein